MKNVTDQEFANDLIARLLKEVNTAETVGQWLMVFGVLNSIQAMTWVEVWTHADPDVVAEKLRPRALEFIAHLYTIVSSASPEVLKDLIIERMKEKK